MQQCRRVLQGWLRKSASFSGDGLDVQSILLPGVRIVPHLSPHTPSRSICFSSLFFALALPLANSSVAMASSTLTCESDFGVAGMQQGEDYITPVRIGATLVAATVTSSWSCKKIGRLSLFFSHWLS